mgnify:CR=1 FL=1
MKKYIIILSTAASRKEAVKIANILLKKKLCACVNIIDGLDSIYRWKGKVERSKENLLIIKTTKGMFEKVEKEIVKNHSYDTPEIIAMPVVTGNKRYLGWISESVK